MINKIYLVTDLGPGDGGKGGIVHKLVNTFHASVVLKFGGGQGSHGILTNGGEKFAFSHWGCGTLEAVPTVITPNFIVIPHAILNEGRSLQRLGINDPYSLLTVDPCAICTTPFHGIASQLHELQRRDAPRGTVGTGAGEAYRLAQLTQYHDEDMILRMQDLQDSVITKSKVQMIAQHYRQEFVRLRVEGLLPEDQGQAQELLELLQDDGYIDWTLDQYQELMHTNMGLKTLDEALQLYSGVAVAECSHGVLTDAEEGFRPHVSALRTLPSFAINTLREAGYHGKIVRLGITRAYAIRHGAGPLPTTDDAMRKRLLPDSHKQTNRWQGEVRVGPLDFNLLRYAIKVCGGADAFDGLCVTCFDQILADGVWKYCEKYFMDAEVCAVCELFAGCIVTKKKSPELKEISCKDYSTEELLDECRKVFWHNLKVPVKLISLGPSDQDKILF